MCRQVGSVGASSHSVRRTFATKLIDDGIALINVYKFKTQDCSDNYRIHSRKSNVTGKD
jgi:hypothetical protein